MTSINATLDIIRRIHQLQAELAEYHQEIKAVETAEPFDFPYWQGLTDEQGWLTEDVDALYASLLQGASAISQEAVVDLEREMADAHEVQQVDNHRTFLWRKNDFDDEVTRKVIWTRLSDNQWILDEYVVWVEEDGIYTDQWKVYIRYCEQ